MGILGVDASELTEAVGSSERQLERWLDAAHGPSARWIEPLARALGVGTKEIVEGTHVADDASTYDESSLASWFERNVGPLDDDAGEVLAYYAEHLHFGAWPTHGYARSVTPTAADRRRFVGVEIIPRDRAVRAARLDLYLALGGFARVGFGSIEIADDALVLSHHLLPMPRMNHRGGTDGAVTVWNWVGSRPLEFVVGSDVDLRSVRLRGSAETPPDGAPTFARAQHQLRPSRRRAPALRHMANEGRWTDPARVAAQIVVAFARTLRARR